MIPLSIEPPLFPDTAALHHIMKSPVTETIGAIVLFIADTLPARPVVTRTTSVLAGRSPWSTAAEATSARPDARKSLVSVVAKPAEPVDADTPTRLAEIRRVTGWSWDRLAQAVGVSRQAVHGWTLGRDVTHANAERIAKLHATLAFIDRGNQQSTRDALGTAAGDGRIACEHLDEGKYDLVRELLGAGNVVRPDVAKWAEASYAVLPQEGAWFDSLLATSTAPADLAEVAEPTVKRSIKPRRKS